MVPAQETRPRSAWVIRYECPLLEVPSEVLEGLRVQLGIIADDLESVDEGSSVWSVVQEEPLRLAVEGWRFSYRVPRRGLLTVVGVHPIPAGADVPRG